MCCLRRIPIVRLLLMAVLAWFIIARRGERPDVNQRLPVLWREVPRLSIDNLQDASGVRIEIQGDFEDDRVKPKEELAGRLDLVLNRLLRLQPVSYWEDGDHVVVSKTPPRDRPMVCRWYQIDDVLSAMQPASGRIVRSLRWRFAWQRSEETCDHLLPPVPEFAARAQIIRYARNREEALNALIICHSRYLFCGTRYRWDAARTMTCRSGKLIVVADADFQDEVAAMLRRLRASAAETRAERGTLAIAQ